MSSIIQVSGSSSGTKTIIQSLTDVPDEAWDEIRQRWPHIRRGEVPDKYGTVISGKSLDREKWNESFVAIAQRHVRAGAVAVGAV